MNDMTPITQAEMAEIFAIYLDPLYKVLGGLAAVVMFALLYAIIIRPLLKKGRGI